MKRHISFCILTTVCQVVQLLDFLHTSFFVTLPDWLEVFCIYYFVLSSVLYSIVRMCEPVVLAAFKQTVSRVFCRNSSKSRESQASKHTSNGSLTTSESSGLTDRSSFTTQKTLSRSSKGLEDGDELTDTLNSFLTSSLNVELVYTILKGIRRLIKAPDLEAWKNGQVPSNLTNDFSLKITL